MNILHTVEFYSPSQGGMQTVVQYLSEQLVRLGHQVTVATSSNYHRKSSVINGVKLKEFDLSGNLVRGITGNLESYRQFVTAGRFDIVTNFAAQQWATDSLLPILDQIPAKKVFVPTGFSALNQPEYASYFQRMPVWLKQYNLNIFLSRNYRDINFAKKHHLPKSKIKIIPNGASFQEFVNGNLPDIRSKLGIPPSHFLVLLVGSHTGVKGHMEAIEIFRAARVPRSNLLIIGNRLPGGCGLSCQLQSFISHFSPHRIQTANLTRLETVAAFRQADLFLFPSNIECSPLVLFESAAARLPFLTAKVGNSAEIISWLKGGRLLPTHLDAQGFSHARIDESASLLRHVAQSPQLLDKMANQGYNHWQKRFTWEKITRQYEQVYIKLLKT